MIYNKNWTGIRNYFLQWRKILKSSTLGTGVCFHSIHSKQPEFNTNIHTLLFDDFQKLILRINRVSKILPADEYLEAVSKGKKRITTICFDDAYASIKEQAIPFMLEHQLPITIFVNSSTLQGNLLWRDRIRIIYHEKLESDFVQFIKSKNVFIERNLYKESKQPQINSGLIDSVLSQFLELRNIKTPTNLYLSQSDLVLINESNNVVFGNHTHNHYLLSSLTREEQKKEIQKCHEALTKLNIKLSNVFAAPFGGYNSVNATTFGILEELGYLGILLTNGLSKVNRDQIPNKFKIKVANRFLP
ncbi:MAG TPA: polysaccharide deacetylase family protein [Fulvivirga sp.]|nr:polysaccharide deacetylase family protein [Fulvivirga sp.]